MRRHLPEPETYLEIGLAALGGMLLVALAIQIVGRALGRAQHGARRRQPPPAMGSVPPERHQNIATVSAR